MNPNARTCSCRAPRSLDAKPAWPQAAKRWLAFWKSEVPRDRVLMALSVPRKKNPYPEPPHPGDFEEYHTNLDYFISRRLHEVYKFEYLAEAVPSTWNSITAGYLGVLLGGSLKPLENGVIWSKPWISEWKKVDALTIDRRNKWLKLTMEQIALLREHRDKFLVRIPDFHGISDALVSIRGAEPLTFDLVDCPDRIDWACGQIVESWRAAYDEVYGCITDFQAGAVIWLGMWHMGKIEVIQEDFADTLSPDFYRAHFMKHDRAFCRHVDKAMFHLHNTMFRYQELTLEMPEITGTQFRPPYDEGRKPQPLKKWLGTYERMQAAGKKLWYSFLDENDMRDAILNGDPRHLFLVGGAADTESAARLMDKACQWTQERTRELGLH